MLFKVNMYRMGREKRLEAQMRIRRFASVATLIAVNVVVVGLFIVAVTLAGRAIDASETRLQATEAALASLMEERGGDRSSDELELVRTRVSQVRWSAVLEVVARLTPKDMWFPLMKLSQGTVSGSRLHVYGLQLSGKLRAGREEEGLSNLMEFVAALRGDPVFKRYFREARLNDSSWVDDDGTHTLEFEIFCPVAMPNTILEGALELSKANPDMIDPDEMSAAPGSHEEARGRVETAS